MDIVIMANAGEPPHQTRDGGHGRSRSRKNPPFGVGVSML